MNPAADLSVAIATRNRPGALARCLDALLAGEVAPSEVVVVDQSDDDATRPLVDDRQGGPAALVYVRDERRGLSASRNAAIARAGRPLLAVTDDDCVPDGGWVATIARTLSGPGAPEAVSGRVLPLGPPRPGLHPVSQRIDTDPREFRGPSLPWLVGTGANFACRCAWLERVGGYDERLGVGSAGKAAEDMDILHRLLRAGARVRYEPAAIVYHERQPTARLLRSAGEYGYGMGAFCGLWLRRGDRQAARILLCWLFERSWALAGNLRRLRPTSAHEESLVLQGTLRGLAYGLWAGAGGERTR